MRSIRVLFRIFSAYNECDKAAVIKLLENMLFISSTYNIFKRFFILVSNLYVLIYIEVLQNDTMNLKVVSYARTKLVVVVTKPFHMFVYYFIFCGS